MKKLKILIVDDDELFLELMSERIRSWGHDVITAPNGKAGIDIFMSKDPGLIILDYMMPEMDGITALKKIRNMDENVPVIMFTAYPDKKSITGAEKLGIISFIPKMSPFTDTQALLKGAIDIAIKRIERAEGEEKKS